MARRHGRVIAANTRDSGPRARSLGLLWLPAGLFFAFFYLYPLARILSFSFGAPATAAGANAIAAATSPNALRALWFSFWQACLATAATLAVGLPAAYVLARYRFPGKAVLTI